MIRPVTRDDVESIVIIYNYYIINSTVTFEEEPISSDEMANRIVETTSNSMPWLVFEQEGKVIGYAYATLWKRRSAYRFSAESTIYLAPDQNRQGVGSQLYEALFIQLRQKGFHTVIGGIALPNPASVALHEKFRMTKVAHFKEVGFKFGQWIDVGYWECLL